MLRACENCGFESDDLAPVHRMYVTPETWDQPGSQEVVSEAEMWCMSCRSQYPNQPVPEAEEG